MKLTPRHREELLKVTMSQSSIGETCTGFVWVNPNTKDVILEDVDVTEFMSFYPNIIVSLWDEGLIVDPDIKGGVEKLRYFLENRESFEYLSYKTFVNGFYGFLSMRKGTEVIPRLIDKYLKLVFNEILDKNDKVFYIDTDVIYHIGDLDFGDLDLSSISSCHVTDVLCIHDKKRYVFYDGIQIGSKGYGKKNRQEAENEFKKVLRERKLNQLGI